MTFSELLVHLEAGGKARRPHWHANSYVYQSAEGPLMFKHQPYWPLPDHTQHGWKSFTAEENAAKDWIPYETPKEATPAQVRKAEKQLAASTRRSY